MASGNLPLVRNEAPQPLHTAALATAFASSFSLRHSLVQPSPCGKILRRFKRWGRDDSLLTGLCLVGSGLEYPPLESEGNEDAVINVRCMAETYLCSYGIEQGAMSRSENLYKNSCCVRARLQSLPERSRTGAQVAENMRGL